MSEKLPFDIESLGEKSQELQETHEHQVTPAEHSKAEKNKQEVLTHARHEATLESSDKQKVLRKIEGLQKDTDDGTNNQFVDSDLKKSTFQKEIKHIRRKLTPNQRAASKIIHQPAVRAVSEVSAKTITRPSGLLGGGLIAFLGTSVYLYLTKHIGIKYNYSVFLVLLVLGFAVGISLELLIRLTKTRKI